MDVRQLEEGPQLKYSMLESAKIFKWLVRSLFALIAATFLLMLWVLGSPDAYHEHGETSGPSAKWPDGSAKTAQDSSWAKAGSQLAQPPAAPPPQQQPTNHG